MAVRALCASLLLVVPVVLAGSQSVRPTAPESFRATAQVGGTAGGVGATITIQIDRYTADADHEAIAKLLKAGNYEAFLEKLRQAPIVGATKSGDRSVPIRWARQQPQGDGRHIAVVTAEPVFFFGAGAPDAKPTAGYDLAAAEFTVDAVGLGSGSMAAAARVKLGGPAGVQIDDYSGKKISLATVARNVS